MTNLTVTDKVNRVGVVDANVIFNTGVLKYIVKSNFFQHHGGKCYLSPKNVNIQSDDNSFRVQIEVTNIHGEFICLVQKSIRLPEIFSDLPSLHLIHKNMHIGRSGRLHETHQTSVKNSMDEVIQQAGESMVTSMQSLIRLYESNIN